MDSFKEYIYFVYPERNSGPAIRWTGKKSTICTKCLR